MGEGITLFYIFFIMAFTSDLNNPEDWFFGYTYTTGSDVVGIDLTTALANTGVTASDLNATSGDVRAVYLALAEALFLAYDAKDGGASTTSSKLNMTRSRVIDHANNNRYSTYIISVQEEGTSIDESFVSTGVDAE